MGQDQMYVYAAGDVSYYFQEHARSCFYVALTSVHSILNKSCERVFHQTDVTLYMLLPALLRCRSQHSRTDIFPEMWPGLQVGQWQHRFQWISIPDPIDTQAHAANVPDHFRDKLDERKGLEWRGLVVLVCGPSPDRNSLDDIIK